MTYSWTDIENTDRGVDIRLKLNGLGANMVTLQDEADQTDADLVDEIALRAAQIATLTTNLAAEIARATAAEALKADLVDGKVPVSQLPSYVDTVAEYANAGSFPETGSIDIIYIALDTAISYRWTGSVYAAVGSGLSLGETSGTAYRGDRGKIAYDHTTRTDNPHSVTLSQLGAGTSAVADIGTAAGTVAAGNDSRIVGAMQKANNLSDVVNAATARTSLGLGSVATESTVPVAKGGTGSTTASDARTALGLGSAAVAAASSFLAAGNNLSDLGSLVTALTNLGLTATMTSSYGTLRIPCVIGGVARVAKIQWNSVVLSNGTYTISWPEPFAAVCSGISCSYNGSGYSPDRSPTAYNQNVNNVTVHNDGTTAQIVVWGIGY